jgi:hypothetical protein
MAGRILKRFLKWFFGILGSVILLALIAVTLVWCFPEKVFTSERVSHWIAPSIHFTPAPDRPSPDAPFLTLAIGKHGFFERSIRVRLAPGCYAPVAAGIAGSEVCIDAADLAFSFRLSRKVLVRLTALDHLELQIPRGKLVTHATAEKDKEESESPGNEFRYLKYLSHDFRWGPIAIAIGRFEIPAASLEIGAKIASSEVAFNGKSRSPKLSIDAHAETPDWIARLGGELYQQGDFLILPTASASYRMKRRKGRESFLIGGEIGAKYGLSTGDLDGDFAVSWRDPMPGVELVKAVNGRIRMRKEELSARTTLKAVLKGKTPLGRLPLLTIEVAAAMRPAEENGDQPIDFDFRIDAYDFAGIRARSDLSVTLVPSKGNTELRWRKGSVRIATADFSKTIHMLSHTPWAIPTPFNVFRGPIVFHTEPFVVSSDRTTIPAVFSTDLTSSEQAFATDTRIRLDLAKKDLGVLGLKIEARLGKVQIRLPDYEPLAPVPALSKDSRIVRYEKKEPTPTAKTAPPSPSFPLSLTIKGPPGSIILLNRFFDPRLTAGIDLASEPENGELKGAITVSAPFDIHYLNREIRLEKLAIELKPAIETTAIVSMERGGYKILATLNQGSGKTKISLGSVPPLGQDEIVSLILYGVPKNSISSEQTRSVGSAQAAMSSEALGIFSFWAFAATPIESVLYDPETQTYSAVVRLPGGVVASIGSNWENERQVALSKSLGRNWAVSTELIKDSDGVDRGGTLLRWRKSY